MTPKEKAKDLVFNFCNIDSDSEMYDSFKMPIFYAQRCAMISVDEILIFILESESVNIYWIEYWNKVKEEIEKI